VSGDRTLDSPKPAMLQGNLAGGDMQHISEFLDAMRAAGVGPSDPTAIKDDDKVNRYHVEGDKPKTQNGVYQLKCDSDGFAVGWFMSHREGDVHKWHSKAQSRSKEDKEKHRAKLEASRREREAAIAAQHAETAARAAGLWAKATRTGVTGYLERKRIGLNGAKIMGDLVVVPMYKDGSLVGLQFIAPDGVKRFLTGVDKSGAYYSMRGDDLSVIRICEGFATACAIRDAYPSNPVVVAWDAGNLKPVAKAMRAKYPDAKIIFCADNDQWTKKPDGTIWNPGLEKARQAAVAIGGASVAYPDFAADDEARRSDWWDWWAEFGVDGVRASMDAASVLREPDNNDNPLDGEVIEERTPDKFKNIRPLGHNRGVYYFLPNNGGQIIKKSAADLARIERLFDLAPLGFWETHYNVDGKTSHSDMAKFAANELIEVCHSIGVWDGKETRGVGVWRENIGPICNTGALIIGEGIKQRPNLFKGKHIYETGSNIIDLDIPPATDGEARALFDICTSLSWKRSQYGYLLSGWLVVAPIGGALRWKPHIWITGRSGSGKSTVMENIVKAILGDYAVCRDGGTTEPGVRKALGVSSRPFVMDEAESESAYDRQKMEAIIGLFRKASSGGVIGNADSHFQAMSCACFAAINPAVKETADKARITLLELEKDTRKDANARYLALMDMIHQTIEGNYSQRIFARTFARIDVLLHNISAFESAAADMFGDKRQADQLAPMIAGAQFLTDGGKISVTDARKWLELQDWQWYISISEETDAQKLVSKIMSSRISYDTMGMRREGAIGDLIELAHDGGEHSRDADKGLRGYGLKLDGDRLLVANGSSNLETLLRNTPWTPWARTLGDYPGADNYGNKSVYFMAGVTSKVVSLPISGLVDRVSDNVETEIPLEDWDE
jgi:putative DNA primase/helicase